MKPSDLKTGMVVTIRDGLTYTVALGKNVDGVEYDLLEGSHGGTLFVDDYKDDFTSDPNISALSPEEKRGCRFRLDAVQRLHAEVLW